MEQNFCSSMSNDHVKTKFGHLNFDARSSWIFGYENMNRSLRQVGRSGIVGLRYMDCDKTMGKSIFVPFRSCYEFNMTQSQMF